MLTTTNSRLNVFLGRILLQELVSALLVTLHVDSDRLISCTSDKRKAKELDSF